MTGASDEELSLQAYLLGDIEPDEQRRIEERLLVDRDYVELLLLMEEELIDGYLRGTLSERERRAFENYFLITPARQRKLRMAKTLRRYINNQQAAPAPTPINRRPSSPAGWHLRLTPAWGMAIAALLVVGVGLSLWRFYFSPSLVDKGRAALQTALRESPVEGRLAGFNWPPQQITLGEQSGPVADKVALASAERYLLDAVATHPGPDSYYALGQLYMAKGELDNAIEQFDKALAGDSNNARLHNDMGAALLQRARASRQQGGDSSLQDFDQSLKHLNQALALDAGLLPALFNRALCYENMPAPSLAQADWQAYLNRDNQSVWADEARRHLKDIEEKKQRSSQLDAGQLPQFLAAYRAGDRETAWKLVRESPREVMTGRPIWWQLLNEFFALTAAGQLAEASERVRALQYVGELELHPGSGAEPRPGRDSYLADLGRYYASSSAKQRAALAEAHGLINEGNRLYLDSHYSEALGMYTKARDMFARNANSGETMLADLQIGYCYIAMGRPEQAQSPLKQISEECRQKGYGCLFAQSSFSLGMVEDRFADHSKALENTRQALRVSEDRGDVYNTQRSLAQMADQYRKLGNFELATSYMNRCLERLSAEWSGQRQMWRNCDQLVQVLNARRLNDAAAAYADEALQLALETKDASNIYVSYIHLALIRSKQQEEGEAIRLAELGLDAAPNADCRAYVLLQLGHLRRQAGELREALSDYDQCISNIDMSEEAARGETDAGAARARTSRLPALRYDAHKGRLFCLFAQGDGDAARAELAATLALLEKYRSNIQEEKNRNTFFNVEQSVYDAAIDFEHSRMNDNPAVFDYSEESRARSLLAMLSPTPDLHAMRMDEVRQQLSDQTLLIEYTALDDKLLVCLLSKSEFVVKEVRVSLSQLTDRVLNFRRLILSRASELTAEAQALYELLIDPVGLSAQPRKQVCIVPDKALNNLPFAALVSPASGNYLIEDYDLTVAPSATVYLACSARANHKPDRNQERLLAVGDPSFDRSAFPNLPPLPSTRQQVRKIAALYSPSLVFTDLGATKEAIKREMAESDVIHLASHYVVYEGDPMNSTLLLAQGPPGRRASDDSPGVLRANEVYGLKLRHAPLVILSACVSGVEHYYNGEGMIGMSRVFIAAGAPVVVASLWKVDVYATDELMVNFHRHRKLEELSTSEALRRAQMDMLKQTSTRHPYYWAGFTTIGGHPGF